MRQRHRRDGAAEADAVLTQPPQPPGRPQVYAPEVVELAKKLYLRNLVVPSWDQIGDVTRSVWCDEATKILEMS